MTGNGDWQLSLLGDFRLRRGADEIHLHRRKVASLLAYLALRPGAHGRDLLAALLWGDYPDREARRSLSVALSTIRSTLGDASLMSDNDTVQLSPAFPLWVDVLAFQAGATRLLAGDGDEPALDLYHGDLLAGYDDEWIAPDANACRALAVSVLLALADRRRAHSDYAAAIDAAQRVLAIEPANERAHQQLMFCLNARGDRSAALRQYVACRQALRDDLGVEPSAETTDLYNRIKGQAERSPAAEARLTNLPIALTSFIGREREIAEVRRLLAHHRLVTLTGPGGSGKTRLAVEVAAGLVDAYPDGVWFSDLAPIQNAAAVPSTVAQAVGAPASESANVTNALVAYLRHCHTLLVFDSCEHMVDACAELTQAILTACPQVTILATSREVLGVAGEALAPVPPLTLPTVSLPDDGHNLILVDLEPFEAARLFVERANSVRPGVALTDHDAPAVAAVCRQLEGMPLAIELAAARVPRPAGTADRRSPERALLPAGVGQPQRATPPALAARRHRLELRCPQPRRAGAAASAVRLCRHLRRGRRPAVFGKGESGDSRSAAEVLDLLARLVDKSLVAVDQAGAVCCPRAALPAAGYDQALCLGEAGAGRREGRGSGALLEPLSRLVGRSRPDAARQELLVAAAAARGPGTGEYPAGDPLVRQDRADRHGCQYHRPPMVCSRVLERDAAAHILGRPPCTYGRRCER